MDGRSGGTKHLSNNACDRAKGDVFERKFKAEFEPLSAIARIDLHPTRKHMDPDALVIKKSGERSWHELKGTHPHWGMFGKELYRLEHYREFGRARSEPVFLTVYDTEARRWGFANVEDLLSAGPDHITRGTWCNGKPTPDKPTWLFRLDRFKWYDS